MPLTVVADPAPRRPRIGLLFAALFFFSGAAGLIDQVVWLRYLSLVFGNTTLATATLLAVFLGGLGAGSWLFARHAEPLARAGKAFTVYALLEAAIGIFAILSPRFFAFIDIAYVGVYRAVGDEPLVFALVRVLLAALCLLPPTLLMGGTLPVLLAALAAPAASRGPARLAPESDEGPASDNGRITALLYGANTLGAVCGVALAGFLTIRLFGLEASLLLSAAINLSVALAAILFRPRSASGGPPVVAAASATAAPANRYLLVAALFMGMTSIACELLWTRILVFYLGSSVYAFSLMLLLFLTGIALGSFAAVRVADRVARPVALLVRLELLLALLAPVSIWLFATLNRRLVALSEAIEPRQFSVAVVAELLAIAPILLPSTLLMGFSFPIAARAYARRGAALGADVGRLYGANTAGSIVGALGAGFVLVPLLGSQNSLLAVGIGNALLAVWLARQLSRCERVDGSEPGTSDRRVALVALLLVPALAIAGALLPPDRVILAAGLFAADRPGDLLYFHEDANAAVAVRQKRDPDGEYVSLELNGVNVAGTSPDLYAVQKLQGHLPLLLGPHDQARVVHIGFGSGGTAHAVSRHPVAEILIVEISPAVLAASDRYFAAINHGVLADRRVRVEINDGRNFLLATARTFDAVLSDSIHPRYAGNGSLYSEEYFRLVAERLAPRGVVSMWLPMYTLTTSNFRMIVRAFKNVFPDTVIWYEPSALNSFTVVTGRKEGGPWDAAELRRTFEDPDVLAALADIGMRSPADILACYVVAGAELDAFLGNSPPHVDDLPAVEYESGTLLGANSTWFETFTKLLEYRPAQPPEAVRAAVPESDQEALELAWQERTRVLAKQQRFLAENASPWR